MMSSKILLLKSFIQNPFPVLLMLFSLNGSIHISMASDDDSDFDDQPTSQTRPTVEGDDSEDEEDDLVKFKKTYTLLNLKVDTADAEKLKARVFNKKSKIEETLEGSFVKDDEGEIQRTFALKVRDDHPKPFMESDYNLAPLIQWYRETPCHPLFAIQFAYNKGTVVLDDYQEVPSLSRSYAPSTFRVFHEDNLPEPNISVFIELTYPPASKIPPQSHLLEDIPYQFLSRRLIRLTDYWVENGAMRIEEEWVTENEVKLPVIPQIPALAQAEKLTPFMMDGTHREPLVGVKAKFLKPFKASKKPVTFSSGLYKILKADTLQVPYLYVETARGKPEFFLTQTKEVTLKKRETSGDQDRVVLRFTQKVGLVVDAQLVGSSSALRTGLLQQRASAQWYPVSQTYVVSPTPPFYQLKITKVKSTESLTPKQLLQTLYKSQDMFYSHLMTLELAHPLLSDDSNQSLFSSSASGEDASAKAAFEAFFEKFCKVITRSYPTFPLPRKLRVLEIGGRDEPIFTPTSQECSLLNALPLNRLTLTNVKIGEADMKRAMSDFEGGHTDEFSVELLKGHCFETFEMASPYCPFKQTFQRERAEQLDQAYRDHCRTYRPKD
ncbi:hypothetical protein [Candidatus Finniella inopinata]|uniref:Uncharacterized protein n=1 Tax=Candidatus Finniella inopinata TaxID=1696036 RepID=A0A4Q7DGP4_9PROT|nr:hypothetical protein [Candidatus Finniella inopinata]RZI45440.1 hypothetical protein EQU50_07060 [Candidatus Finniella inopinata]